MLAREFLDYADSVSNTDDAVLQEVERSTHLHTLAPQMLSGRIQGALLTLLTSMIQARRVLEIGTFTGYGTICLARGVDPTPGSKVVTIEANAEFAYLIKKHLDWAGVTDQVECVTGDALKVLGSRTDKWDLVYIDANKQEYLAYYDAVVDHVRPGGLIITDNVLWGGKVLTDPDDVDAKVIRAYNERVYRDPRTEVIVLTVRDGLSIARKRPQ